MSQGIILCFDGEFSTEDIFFYNASIKNILIKFTENFADLKPVVDEIKKSKDHFVELRKLMQIKMFVEKKSDY